MSDHEPDPPPKPPAGSSKGGWTVVLSLLAGLSAVAVGIWRVQNATSPTVPPIHFPNQQNDPPSRSLEEVLADLHSADPAARQRGVAGVRSHARNVQVAEALTLISRDADEKLGVAVAQALTAGDGETARAVFATLRQEGSAERARLAACLFGTEGLGQVALLASADGLVDRDRSGQRLMLLGHAIGQMTGGADRAAVGAVNDPDRRVRLVAIYALARPSKEQQKEAAEALEPMLAHADGMTRQAAGLSLGHTPTGPGREALLRGLKHPDPGAKIAACGGWMAATAHWREKLKKASGAGAMEEIRLRLAWRKEWEAYVRPAAPLLAGLLGHDDRTVREFAAGALEEFPHPVRKEADAPLRAALEDKSKRVRASAAAALIDLGKEQKKLAEPVLNELRNDRDLSVRRAVRQGQSRGRLGDLDDPVPEGGAAEKKP